MSSSNDDLVSALVARVIKLERAMTYFARQSPLQTPDALKSLISGPVSEAEHADWSKKILADRKLDLDADKEAKAQKVESKQTKVSTPQVKTNSIQTLGLDENVSSDSQARPSVVTLDTEETKPTSSKKKSSSAPISSTTVSGSDST